MQLPIDQLPMMARVYSELTPHPNGHEQSSRPHSATSEPGARAHMQSPKPRGAPYSLTTPAAASSTTASVELTQVPRPAVQLRHAQSLPTYHGAHRHMPYVVVGRSIPEHTPCERLA